MNVQYKIILSVCRRTLLFLKDVSSFHPTLRFKFSASFWSYLGLGTWTVGKNLLKWVCVVRKNFIYVRIYICTYEPTMYEIHPSFPVGLFFHSRQNARNAVVAKLYHFLHINKARPDGEKQVRTLKNLKWSHEH